MEKDTAIYIIAADGIKSLQTGVGVIVNFIFESFNELDISKLDNIQLNAICPKINTTSNDFVKYAYDITLKSCLQAGGEIIELERNLSGKTLNEVWKGTRTKSSVEIWEDLCIEISSIISSKQSDFSKIVIVAHDTLFVNLASYLNDDILFCWIPHSLGTLFKSPDQNVRIDYEFESISKFSEHNHMIGYISHLTKDHLKTNYHYKSNLISFYSGIYFESSKYKIKGDNYFLKKYNIPADKKIILAWGRCSFQKGIDIVLKAYIKLINENTTIRKSYHLILIAPVETSYDKYLEEVLQYVNSIPKSAITFVSYFQHKLQYEILAYQNTDLILLNSRYETFGLTSIEALNLSNTNSKIIYSNLPTFEEVLKSSNRTYRLIQNSFESLCDLISELSEPHEGPNKTEQECFAVQEYQNRFSFTINYNSGFNNLLKLYLNEG